MLAAEKSVLVFALDRERIEAEKRFVDKAGMAHDQATLGQAVEKMPHQRAEIPLPRPVVGAGESRIEGDIGALGPASKLRAQRIDHQGLGRAQPAGKLLAAAALANPGLGGGVLYRRQEG